MIRWELLYTQDRLNDAIQNGQYVNVMSDELTAVLGVDYNGLELVDLDSRPLRFIASSRLVARSWATIATF